MRDETALASEVLEKIPNKYMAVIVAAKRARNINSGNRQLVRSDAAKPTTVAMEEIANGLVIPDTEKLAIEEAAKAEALPAPDEESKVEDDTADKEE